MTTKKITAADNALDQATEQLVLAFKTWVSLKENQKRWSPEVQKHWLADLGQSLDDVWLEAHIRSVVDA